MLDTASRPNRVGFAVLDEGEVDDTARSYLLMKGHLETDQHLSHRSGLIAGSDKVIIEGDATSFSNPKFSVEFDGRLYCKVWADPHGVDPSQASSYEAEAEAQVASWVKVPVEDGQGGWAWESFWSITQNQYDYVASDSVGIVPEQTASSEVVVHASYDRVFMDYDRCQVTNYLFGMVSLESDRYDPLVRVHGRVRSKLSSQDPDPVRGKVIVWEGEEAQYEYIFE